VNLVFYFDISRYDDVKTQEWIVRSQSNIGKVISVNDQLEVRYLNGFYLFIFFFI
jgi:hypothetical protein